ncbi:ergothioneine biosynthesis protein EgtB [Pedobacter sp. GR22-10]|uniref:ergothioneine biosynthesis protein EgtB n=1 Tax=Pedobacter sp. GR22-10 TaxID=2994472 RepID=UPI0022453B4C|nr:ergothioneine biosynthesis protein EgtB [Pedobacter sp. GR22-10]MCX2433464.1 ergothioneine biosynthesis protein EgtB [Pedobacter sp. GR22-10]
MSLVDQFLTIRKYTESICEPLQTEDYVVQPVADVSPPKWHLGHTTWFFETFILKPHAVNYQEYNPDYNFVFNSYYETVGARVIRTDRGNLSRPSVSDIYQYRHYIDEAMTSLLGETITDEVMELLILGFNHEQQHQELLLTDIKYILGNNPLFPVYSSKWIEHEEVQTSPEPIVIAEGIYEIGFAGSDFCFDNELSRHKVYLHDFEINAVLETNGTYLDFIKAGGYSDFNYWHAEGWDWVKTNGIKAPMYWQEIDGDWFNYTYAGLVPLNRLHPVTHISYYEAYAYASWKGMRLPTEFEWEVAARQFNWGKRWEWTESAYLPYPGFSKAPGAIGEYNGKFMVNQKVLRGASVATPKDHGRITYRNFFHPHLRWQFTGIRLAK